MPSDIAGNYSLPSGYLAVAGTTILTTQHNPIFQDVAQGLTDRIMANGAKAMTGELTLSGNPATALGAAPKQYVDAQALAAVAALDIKPSVVAATTANITLSAPQTIDGVSVVAADRVLVKNQTAPAENGIYIVGAAAWSRATDMAAWTAVPGAIVAVEGGTQWQDTLWLCTPAAGGTIGTTAMTWRRFDTNVTRNAQTGTSYTVLADDHNRHVTFSNASAIAVTLPQATTTFGFGFQFIAENLGAGVVTITPTTSTINGGATIKLGTGEAVKITSDGTNYRALGHGATFTNINGLTEDTAPLGTDFVGVGDVTNSTAGKVKLQAVHSPGTSTKTGNYTVVDADRGTTIRFAGLSADATLTLPAAAGRTGFLLYVVNADTTEATPWGVTIDPNSSETLDGAASRKGYFGTRVTIVCDGTNWNTVSGIYRYSSGNQTITASGTLSLAHGLGVRPTKIWTELQCTTTEHNYTVGDRVTVGTAETDGAAMHGVNVSPDATNLTVLYSSSATTFTIPNKSTRASSSATNANWRLRVYAEE